MIPERAAEIKNAILLSRDSNGFMQLSIIIEWYKNQSDQIPNDAIKPFARSDNLKMCAGEIGSMYEATVALNTDNIQSEKSRENRKKARYELLLRLIDRTVNPIKLHNAAAKNVNCIIDALPRLVQ